MSGSDQNGGARLAEAGEAEVILKGRSVSRGVSVGKALCLYGTTRQFYRIEISPVELSAEIERLHNAFQAASQQLANIADVEKAASAAAGILEAQRLMLEDAAFVSDIVSAIEKKLVNAEWAVKETAAAYIARYKALPDARMRERYIDVEDVSERIVTALGGSAPAITKVTADTVIAAHELRPSTLAEFTNRPPGAIITEHGGWTSHTFILARELEIPAVTGVRRLLRRLKTGATVMVDGYNGVVTLDPSPQRVSSYRTAKVPAVALTETGTAGECCATLDGREIVIRANLDLPTVYNKAASLGARGVGLYRSEFLFNQFRGFPPENEQFDAYCAIADFAGEDGVKIRTFDIGATQIVSGSQIREKNPALGLRAIRLSKAHEKHFRVQVRAILRAADRRSIDIVIPMVTGVSEINWAKEVLDSEKSALIGAGMGAGSPRIGAMIEVPSAVLMIEELLQVCDFILLGTNDLVQYLLAADRDNESVADWFRTLHPAVLRALDKVISACRAAGKPLVVCGEMAGSPFYVPVLVGLGASELSMSINSILRARRVIAGIAYEEALHLAHQMLRCSTAEEAEHLLAQQVNGSWSHLFPAPAGEQLA